MFAGNIGAVIAGAPLAWLVTQSSWRNVFLGLAALSILLAAATWWKVRDRPQDLGFAPVNAASPSASAGAHWTLALRQVLGNAATWPGFFVNVGIGGSYLAFAGLWAVPYLVEVQGMSRLTAAQHASLLVLGVAFGSLAIGTLSDRLGSRRGLMRACTLLFALSWLPWLLEVRWPLPATLGWFLLMGLLIPGFTLSWAVAKEVNRPEHSGMATSVVNVGIFLGTGILQPWVGHVLDRGRTAGDAMLAWQHALWLLAGSAMLGAAATWLVREHPRVR